MEALEHLLAAELVYRAQNDVFQADMGTDGKLSDS
jgi:hypothetical protein